MIQQLNFFYCFDWHVPLAQLSPTGTFNSHAPEWYVNFKQIPEIATRSEISVILVAIVEHFFLELFYFWVLARFPPTTHNIHFSYDFAPLKFHKLAKQVRCAFSHAPSSGNWAAFVPPRTTAWLALVRRRADREWNFYAFLRVENLDLCVRNRMLTCFSV